MNTNLTLTMVFSDRVIATMKWANKSKNTKTRQKLLTSAMKRLANGDYTIVGGRGIGNI